MKRAVILLIGGLICISGFAGSEIDVEELKQRYSKYNAVIIEQNSEYLIDIKGDSLYIQQTNSKQVLILSEHSKAYTNDYIYIGGFCRLKEKEAYTRIPNGKKYEKIKVKTFKEYHDRSGSAFFDDSKAVRFSYPSVQQGVITSSEYTLTFDNPRFLRHYFLQSWIPIVNSKLVLKVHKDVKIGFKIFNEEAIKIKYNKYSKGKYNYYEWEVNDVEPFNYEGADNFGIRHYSPHIALYIDETNINNEKVKYFGETADLYRYYTELLSTLEHNHSNELVELVNELTIGLTDREKAKAIYYWVQNNIKYVAYEQGYSGFIPDAASNVLSKRFGDCKGMSNIIKEMMDLAGLPTYITWVGTRHVPYKYDELPLPSVDNHMIATYIKDDSVFVMDATFKYLDFGKFPYHIQEKEILIGITPDQYKIYEVPVSPAIENQIIDSVNISITGDSISGEAICTHSGLNKMELSYAMDGVKKEDYEKILSLIYNKGSNKFNVDSFKLDNLFERDATAKTEYEFKLHDYYTAVDNEIYINLHLDKSFQDFIIDTTGLITPIENDFYFIETHITRLEIPEGYTLNYIPENGSFKNKEFEFTINYSHTGNYLIMKKVIKMEFLLLLEDKLSDWNQMIKQLNKHYRSSIVLKKDN